MQAAGQFMRSVSVISESGIKPAPDQAEVGLGEGQLRIEEGGQYVRQSTNGSHISSTSRWSRLSQGGTPPTYSRVATTVSESIRGEEAPAGLGAEGGGAPSQRQLRRLHQKPPEGLRRCLSPEASPGGRSASATKGMGRRSNSSASICSSLGANFLASSSSLQPMRSLMIDAPLAARSGSDRPSLQQVGDGGMAGSSAGVRLSSLIASAEARRRSAEAAAALRGFRA